MVSFRIWREKRAFLKKMGKGNVRNSVSFIRWTGKIELAKKNRVNCKKAVFSEGFLYYNTEVNDIRQFTACFL